jgi:NitT/TauT family transport system substrate-binding protein/putative hydroxymethylpyrimidine transport system substrate-binding protein
MGRVAALLAAALVSSAAIAACGGDGGAEPGAPEGATLVLDFQPNAVHAPIYAARSRGYLEDAGIDLEIREPSSSADAAKLLQAGRADFAILDINDFGIARERGIDLVAIAAIVQRPLASVIAGEPEKVSTPADLEGTTVGVTGVPSDDAVLDTVLASGGLAPDDVERVTIGFAAVPSLAAGKIAAATAFWNAEGVELRAEGIPTREFRVDEFGAPRYPELVVATTGDGAPSDPDLTCALLEGLGSANGDMARDPQSVLDDMLTEVDGLDADSQKAQFAELIAADAFSQEDDQDPDPALPARGVSEWAAWATRNGVLGERPGPPLTNAFLADAFLPDAIRDCATGETAD